jgi:hypothetical protein
VKKQYVVLLGVILFSLLLCAVLSCSTTKTVVDKIVPFTPDLKKRIMIAPLVDQAEFGKERTTQIGKTFVEHLRKSPHLILFQDPQSIPSGRGSKSPEYGIVIPPELVQRAQDLGMNALIIAVLNPLEATSRKTGIWPFREMSRIIEISMTVNIIDTASGCLYLTQLDSEEMDFMIDELPGRDENEVIDQIIEAKMPRILKRQSSAAIKNLIKQPWTGQILSVENGRIKINAGKDVGIRPDQSFAVFARGESITCRAGRSFDIQGKKIGEIKITAIMEKHSLAEPVGEGSFLAGQTIRPND